MERGTVAALALAGLLVGCRSRELTLPDLPSFVSQNESSVAKIRKADRAARESAEAVEHLCMLYHAYQFLDQARQCYEAALRLAPDVPRLLYYAALAAKSAFAYEAAESLFLRALERKPSDAELEAELGELYLMWNRREAASEHLERALELDPLEPTAVLGKARLLVLDEKWKEVIELLAPLLEEHPRLSRAHQLLAAAHGALGNEELRAFHQQRGEYGSAVETERKRELHNLSVDAILQGDPSRGPEILRTKCARCHDHQRIYDRDEDRLWWARTVRRMQREAGWDWLTDEQAAAVVAYLAREP